LLHCQQDSELYRIVKVQTTIPAILSWMTSWATQIRIAGRFWHSAPQPRDWWGALFSDAMRRKPKRADEVAGQARQV